jgi:hypothetical protein
MMKMLLAKNCSLPDSNLATRAACQGDHAKILMLRDVDKGDFNTDGFNVFHALTHIPPAPRYGINKDLVRTLLSCVSDPNLINSIYDDLTPLQKLIENSKELGSQQNGSTLKIAQQLLNHGATFTEEDRKAGEAFGLKFPT